MRYGVGGVALALLLGACGKAGDGRFAGLSVFRADDESFLVRYRNPPWKKRYGAGRELILEIERLGADLVDVDVDGGGTNAAWSPVGTKYFLSATVVAPAPADCIGDALDVAPEGHTVLEGPKDVRTAAGNDGRDVTYKYDADEITDRYARVVCLEHPDGALKLYFDALPDLREAEVDEMIAGVEVAEETP